MKTIQELNSKWWWRLVKVIYIFVIIVIFTGTNIEAFYETKIYNPKIFEKIWSDIQKPVEFVNKIKVAVESLNWNYSGPSLKSISSSWIVKTWPILYILAKYPDVKIEWVDIVCKMVSKTDCYFNEINDSYYKIYMDYNIRVEVPEYQINSFREWIDSINKINYLYNNVWNDQFNYDLINNYNQFFWEEISVYKDYHWFSEYIKIICFSFLIFIWIITISLILRGTLFYIILWKFNPEK